MTADLQAARERIESLSGQLADELVDRQRARERIGELEDDVGRRRIALEKANEAVERHSKLRLEAEHKQASAEARLQTLEAENARLRKALEYPRFGNTANLLDKAVEQIEKMSQRLNELRGENWVPFYVNHYANAAKEMRAALAPQQEDRP